MELSSSKYKIIDSIKLKDLLLGNDVISSLFQKEPHWLERVSSCLDYRTLYTWKNGKDSLTRFDF